MIRELDLEEMGNVSGGTEDEIVVTATRVRRSSNTVMLSDYWGSSGGGGSSFGGGGGGGELPWYEQDNEPWIEINIEDPVVNGDITIPPTPPTVDAGNYSINLGAAFRNWVRNIYRNGNIDPNNPPNIDLSGCHNQCNY